MPKQTKNTETVRRVQHATERWDITVDADYEETLETFDRLVPPADFTAFLAAKTWEESLEIAKNNAPMGFMTYWKSPAEGLMKHSQFRGKSMCYLMGNHTIAERMARYDTDVFLHAPLRVLFHSKTPNVTHLAINRPSSNFSSFDNPHIAAVGKELDGLVQNLFAALGAPINFNA